MVTITGYTARKNDDGETFSVLELQGEIEILWDQRYWWITCEYAYLPVLT